jgi:hypothetical protein
MAEYKVTLDISSLSETLSQITKDVVNDVQKSIKALAIDTHSHIKEKAQNNLHSFRDKYLESLSPPEQVNDFMWIITLNDNAEWIEEGRQEPYDMKPGLLKDGKNTKDGHRYRIIPMDQAKTPTQLSGNPLKSPYQKATVELVKHELKKRNISYRKLELDPATGSPRIGKLHSLDIDSNIPGKGNTPQLHGLTIFQVKNPKTGKVERKITTFRTVTDREDQRDKWIHPPVEGKKFFEEARTWAEEQWEKNILPALTDKYK